MLKADMILLSRKKVYLIFLLLLTLLLLPQCGLHSYPYLEQPDVVGRLTGSPGQFMIMNRNYDPDIFRGYELYYRFYHNTNIAARTNDDNFISRLAQPEPRHLIDRGFRRVTVSPQNAVPDIDTRIINPPMIPVERGNRDNNFELVIDFLDIQGNRTYIPQVRYLSQVLDLYRDRAVIDPDTGNETTRNRVLKSFGDLRNDSPAPRDHDLRHFQDYHVTLSLYIFAYGIHEGIRIWSRPESGFITYFE